MSSNKPCDLVVAVDIGGTFTDIALQDLATGQSWTAKTPSTPRDPSEAFLTGLRLAVEAAQRDAAKIGRVLHGTTVATNMILEGKAAPAALVTTEGFRHVMEIGRQDIPRAANLFAWVKPKRPVPPSRVLEVPGRIAGDGSELQPLDEEAVRRAAARCRTMGVQAVAVCLLHAYANPDHERHVAAILRAELPPEVAVSASTEVLPVIREYERSLAVVLNAQVMPAVSTYVGRIERRLEEAGIAAPLLLMQSNGGVAGARVIRRAPATTALSGPAAGVVGARAEAAAAGIADVITVDIGGTSADISLIKGGRIGLTQHGHVGGWPLPLPMLDMVTIGAGGGSLARVTDGALTVGPQSAGADPGPACYGRGGERPTTTDAHVVLGHLPPRLLGGRMALDAARAEAAVRIHVAEPLGMSLHDAARGMLTILDHAMVGAMRVVSVERGHDPRDFALVAFGGAGPLHGASLADLLGIRTVVVPRHPGVLCAQGLLAADLGTEFTRSLPRGQATAAAIAAAFGELEEQARAWFAEEAVPEAARVLSPVVLMRYAGQGSELPVPWRGAIATAEYDFAAAHRALYGFDLPEGTPELVTLRLEARGRLPAAPPLRLAPGSGAVPVGRHTLHLREGTCDAPLYERATLGAGDAFDGPAIVMQFDATTLVPPGWHARMHGSGVLLLERAG
ncbi:5-oxoprolinase [Falsiroseomonas bella]|uniref:5-oxoprolinase n=1 Tax=Falsiroseomonas bella TaxID=2184016 RepID=A0A317FF41_9PROT|nr:hydantoinase/oxoprolinase family protein [Falsiroseomonas bella]PWS37724.1 5-oxoprolinase [Falsiroseomonas bella]